jgi:cold shock CspA family protein/ribosome-associated translation inhibitor RaiA
MEIPPEITFRDVDKTDADEQLILEKNAKLDEIYDGIVSCRVAVEKMQEHQRSGSPYRIRIALRVPPGHELVVRRESGEGKMHERLETVVTDAFDAVRRQLIKLKDKQQGDVKSHPKQEQLVGHVVRLFTDQGYGFIRTTEGGELYFHRNSVLHDDFERLEIGTGVRYFPREGEEGPQASTVQIVDKPGVRTGRTADSEAEPPQGWKP